MEHIRENAAVNAEWRVLFQDITTLL